MLRLPRLVAVAEVRASKHSYKIGKEVVIADRRRIQETEDANTMLIHMLFSSMASEFIKHQEIDGLPTIFEVLVEWVD
jgi:hypothetical protein